MATTTLKADFPILPVIQKYLKTTTKGSGCWAICPFHKDTSPSLSISESRNIFKCFACNTSGNAINFVMRIEKCGYVEAVKKIGEILNVDISPYLNAKHNKLHSLFRFNEHIALFFHKYLFNKTEDCKQALNYLTQTRKLSKETITKYKIGYSPLEDILEPIIELYQQQNSLQEETIRESNLFTYSKDGKRFPFFKNRIIFPILNQDHNIIGFSGRGDNPKYLNLRNNSAFSKSTALFNIDNLEERKPIYLFEGFLDLMKASQELDCTNGIACMGGEIDPQTFPTLKKYSNEIILCLDNDAAGRTFTINTGKKFISGGFEVRVVDYSDRTEKDIDEMIDKDPKYTKKQIDNPIPFLDWVYKKQKPNNLDATRFLVEEYLDTFLVDNKSLKSDVPLSYAQKLIDQIFNWYSLTPESKQQDLSSSIEKKKQEYHNIVSKSVILQETKPQIREPSYRTITNPFTKIAIKYQQLIPFLNSDLEEHWKGLQRYEWEYSIPENFKLNLPEIVWFFQKLSPEEIENPIEKPEILDKFQKHSLLVDKQHTFFDKYYSFHKEYLEQLGLFYLKDPHESLEERYKRSQTIKEEIKKLNLISRTFFKNSRFSKKERN